MNIVLFKYSLNIGGAEKQLLLLANHLPAKYKIIIIAQYFDKKLVEQLNSNISFFNIPSRSLYFSIKYLRYIFKKNRIDICHCWDFKSSFLGCLATRFSGVKLIDGSIRSAPNSKLKYYHLYKNKFILLRILGIPIISNSKAGLASYGIRKYKKAHVIYNAIIPERKIENETNMNNDYKIGMLANMRWKKDFLTFIKAGLEILKTNQNVTFYLIGDGPDREKYVRFLQADPMKNHFIFTGFLSDPGSYIKQMDICILLNNESGEGLSNSIMEYMAHAKPVIVTDLGGNNEIVKNNETGYLVRENDHLEIANKLNYLIANPVERKRMGENGLEFILMKYSIKKMIANYLSVYKEITAKSNA